ISSKRLQVANSTYRSADGWLEAATQIAHRSNGSPSQFCRAGVGGASPWCVCAMDYLVAGSRDVAAHLDARCVQRLGHSVTLVHRFHAPSHTMCAGAGGRVLQERGPLGNGRVSHALHGGSTYYRPLSAIAQCAVQGWSLAPLPPPMFGSSSDAPRQG